MAKKRRKPRFGVPAEVRRFEDLLRDLDSVRRRLRNFKPYVHDMALLSAAMRHQMAEIAESADSDSEEALPLAG